MIMGKNEKEDTSQFKKNITTFLNVCFFKLWGVFRHIAEKIGFWQKFKKFPLS
jgi:hypothetical protein